jgi:hypothetical protein
MLTKDDILEKLLEPYASLSKEELADAEKLARTDKEVALALKACRDFSEISEAAVFGESRTSDAEFLVALRERISPTEPRLMPSRAFVSGRALAFATVGCMVLMVVILGSNQWLAGSRPLSDQSVANFASAIETSPAILDADSLAKAGVNADSLAAYLDVADLVEAVAPDDSSDDPVSDQLLALDPQSIEEVLATLEDTNFF